MRILVTGSDGFVGRNLMVALGTRTDITAIGHDLADVKAGLREKVLGADFVIHLAGVNRPPQVEQFQVVNAGLTEEIIALLETEGRATPIILSSSIQAAFDNPYGKSKKKAEGLVFDYGHQTGAKVCVYRFPNIFGKWCRPNYNSAVATFCHNIARDMPVQINDPSVVLSLVYIDDLLDEIWRALDGKATREGAFCHVPVNHMIKVGELVDRIRSFRALRSDLSLPDLADPLTKKLYSTYLSNLPEDRFKYPLNMHSDVRGSFTEFLRTPERGQMSVNISKPGVTKGNHWHHTKTEKFLVVSGTGLVRFRKVGTSGMISYEVTGEKLEVVEIPPGYTHDITNLGTTDMVTLMWANDAFDPDHPDTYFEKVMQDKMDGQNNE